MYTQRKSENNSSLLFTTVNVLLCSVQIQCTFALSSRTSFNGIPLRFCHYLQYVHYIDIKYYFTPLNMKAVPFFHYEINTSTFFTHSANVPLDEKRTERKQVMSELEVQLAPYCTSPCHLKERCTLTKTYCRTIFDKTIFQEGGGVSNGLYQDSNVCDVVSRMAYTATKIEFSCIS